MLVLKAILLAAVVVCAGLAVAVAVAGERSPLSVQEGPVQWEPVILSPAEQIEIQAGRIIVRAVPAPGLKGRTFEAVGTFHASLDEVLAIVTDYRHYDEFMPRVERTIVTDESATVFLVEQHLKLPLGVHRRFRLRYTVRQGTEGLRIDWVKVAWPEVPLSHSVVETSGHWQIGRFGEGRLLAVYHVYTDPGKVPLGMKGLALSISKHDLPKIIERVRRRLKSAPGSGPIKD